MIIKEKTSKRLFKIVIVFMLIVFMILLAQFTLAKYIEQKNGQATAKIAEMKFKINGDYYECTDKINFSYFRDDRNPKIVENILAPGTYGHVPIIIDAKETQTSLEYEINIDLTDKPTNLKFYSDEDRTEEILVKNDKIIRKGYISIDDENDQKIKYETIYWRWLTETGENIAEIDENDVEDSKFMDKLMKMQIKVKGTQVDKKPIYLGEIISIGDTIKYNLANGTIVNGIVVNVTNNQVDFIPVDENGKAVVTAENLSFYSENNKDRIVNYNKAISIINKKAISDYTVMEASRALNMEDIIRITGKTVEPEESITYSFENQTFIVDKLMTVTTTTGENIKAILLPDINVGDTITIGQTIGDKKIQSVTVNIVEENSYILWQKKELPDFLQNLSARIVFPSYCYYLSDTERVGFCLRYYNYRYIGAESIYRSDNKTPDSYINSVTPVISIVSTMHAKQIIDENNSNITIFEVKE